MLNPEDRALVRGLIGAGVGLSFCTGYDCYQAVTDERYRWDGFEVFIKSFAAAISGALLTATFPYGPAVAGLVSTPYFISEWQRSEKESDHWLRAIRR